MAFGRKNKNAGGFSPLGKIGIDDFNVGGKGLGKGSHNEVSFNVLQSKSDAADPVSSFSPSTVTRPVWDIPPAEVEVKKRQRKKNRRLALTAIITMVVAAAVIIAAVAVLNYQHSMDYVGRMKESLQEIMVASDKLEPLENLASDLLSKQPGAISAKDAQTRWQDIQPLMDSAKEQLNSAKQNIEELQEHLSPSNLEISNHALAAISAELNMMNLSKSIMDDYVLDAAQAYDDSVNFKNQILEADSLAREAAQLLENPTIEKAQESIGTSEESLSAFETAKTNLEDIQITCEQLIEATPADRQGTGLKSQVPPTVNETGTTLLNILFGPYIDYLDLRIQAQKEAIAGDNAYINRDKNTLISTTEKYNALETKAAAQISQIKTEPQKVVAAAFEDCRLADSERFSSERSRAEVAITAIRNYLG